MSSTSPGFIFQPAAGYPRHENSRWQLTPVPKQAAMALGFIGELVGKLLELEALRRVRA